MSDADAAKDVEAQSRPENGAAGVSTAGADEGEGKAKPTAAPSGGNDSKTREDVPSNDALQDSEAETVVLTGRDGSSSGHQRKAIKHEGNGQATPAIAEPASESRRDKESSNSNSDSLDKKSGKDLTATSSNLSSAKSSPAPDTAPSPAASDNDLARPDGKDGSEPPFMGLLSRKRKNTSDDHDDKAYKRRQRRDPSPESTTNTTVSDRDRRDKRDGSNAGSESPQPRTRTRGHSIKSGQQPVQKRKKPPPLQVGTRTRHSVEAEEGTDDSDRQKSSHKLRKPLSSETMAMSPAKPPHRKLKDKSGRTFLARACDTDDVDAVKARLRERPEDLNVEDHAGNTPLQIAALAGSDDIVKVLLDAGCDIHCKNVDKDTPLIDAVENGHLEVVRLLVNAGMDPGQSNARGEELLDLLDTDLEYYQEIKDLLEKAKEQRRRASEDHPRGAAGSHTRSPRESAHPSPPPSLSAGSRRRATRRDPTRNDLLYVNATPENLRERAKIGDDEAVDYILNMRPIADLPAVLAAARGGHEMSLQLLIAIGKPEHDPDPLPGEKLGQSTPMLAAIGRGNLRVIELLLEQSGFNPTRRAYKNLTYHEIAKDRRGSNWEDEYKLLKRAYENHKGRNSNGTSPSSKRDSQALKKSKSDSNTSTLASIKRSSPEVTKDGLTRKRSGLEVKRTIERREKDRSGDKSSSSSRKHLRVPTKVASREQSTAISDREASPLGAPREREKKHKRSMSEAEAAEEMPKPRKRLVSGKELRDSEEKRRRASLVSVASSSSQEPSKQQKDSPNGHAKKIKREESRDSTRPNTSDPVRKRPRPSSPSPSEGNSPNLRKSPELKKTRRVRVDSDGKVIKRGDPDKEGAKRDSPQPSTERSSSFKSSAPVAFMSGSTSQSKESSKSKLSDSKQNSPKVESRKQPSPRASPKTSSGSKDEIKREREAEEKEQFDMAKQLQDEMQNAAKQEELRQKQREEQLEKERKEKERKERELHEQQEKERLAREEAERKAKEEAARQEAQREAQRQAEEAERKARIAREREEEEARQRKLQEEEQARLAAERERKRKEEEERQARRRAEQEERERLARIKKREEEERRRREALPNALKILAELSPEQARQESEIKHWLPLYTVKGFQLDAPEESTSKDELWISNIQAAGLLGVHDLELSQYTAWIKRPATKAERASLWRVLRLRLTRYEPDKFAPVDHAMQFRMDRETREKYDALKSVFWVRLSDLQDIVPRYHHLAGVDLRCTAIAMSCNPGSKHAPTSNGHPSPPLNGTSQNNLPNGYH